MNKFEYEKSQKIYSFIEAIEEKTFNNLKHQMSIKFEIEIFKF
jgi:hypothetical protein